MPSLPKAHEPTARAKRHAVEPTTNRIRGRRLQKRNARMANSNPLCVLCEEQGLVTQATEWDHIIPLHKGGADHESNIQGLCHEHHSAKTAAENSALRGYGQK